MEYKEFTDKSVDAAITQACLELGVTSDRLDYTVLQEASSGFLGIGSKPAIIKARARSEEELEKERIAIEKAEQSDRESVVTKILQPEKKVITSDEIEKRAAAAAAKAKAEGRPEVRERPERREGGRRDRRSGHDKKGGRDFAKTHEETPVPAYEPSRPKPDRVVKPISEEQEAELKQTAEDFLKSVFDAMQIEAAVTTEYSQTEGALSCTFSGDEMGILIGKRGQTLDSLQYLTSLVVNKKSEEYIRVKLDTEDYRARRADTLNNLARNIAYKVKKTHRPVSLEPMNPYERRIIHSSLQGNRFVETYSEGEEPYRHVVVTPKR